MSRKQKNRVGVIGLGQVGSKVSAGLRSAGFSVYVWNRSPKAEPNFLGSAIEVADLCDTIQLFVPDDAALDAVIRTITAALRPRHVIIASTTVTPSTARELGAIVESAGARYVDAPFAGSRADAEARQLVYYVGGSESAVKDARPVLQATSRSIVPVGAIGDASLLKLSLQMLTAVTLEGLAETLSFVRAGGVKPEALLDALEEDPTRSAFLSEKLSAMVKENFDGGTPIRHLFRDLQLALKLAGSNPPVPATGVVAGLLFGAMKRGWATSDGAIISRAFEPEAAPAPPAAKTEPVAIQPTPAAEAAEVEAESAPKAGDEIEPAVAAESVAESLGAGSPGRAQGNAGPQRHDSGNAWRSWRKAQAGTRIAAHDAGHRRRFAQAHHHASEAAHPGGSRRAGAFDSAGARRGTIHSARDQVAVASRRPPGQLRLFQRHHPSRRISRTTCRIGSTAA